MRKVSVILATGFEEAETVTIMDVLRRAGFQCDLVSLNGEFVSGTHGMVLKADVILGSDLQAAKHYDMLVLPGGWGGVDEMEADDRVLELVRYYDASPDKYVAAMCAAPSVLAKAGVVRGKRLTCYPSDKLLPLFGDSVYADEVVVVDGNLITSIGPATALPFAFKLVDILGGDSGYIKGRLLYNLLAQTVEQEGVQNG